MEDPLHFAGGDAPGATTSAEEKGFWMGLLLSIIGNILVNVGTNVVKLGHIRVAKKKAAPQSPTYEYKYESLDNGSTSPILGSTPWGADAPAADVNRLQGEVVDFFEGLLASLVSLGRRLKPAGMRIRSQHIRFTLGWSLFAVGNACNFASFSFAPQSTLASFGSIQFVANIAFARFVNQEKITKRLSSGTALICIGILLMVNFGAKDTSSYYAEQIRELFLRPEYVYYMMTAFPVAVKAWMSYHYLNHTEHTLKLSRTLAKLKPVTYAVYSSIIGAQSVLFGKCLSMLLSHNIESNLEKAASKGDHISAPDTEELPFQGNKTLFVAALIGLLITTATFWVRQLNTSLRKFPAVTILPVMQMFWMLVSMVEGGVFFKEFEQFQSRTQVFAYGLGFLIVSIGTGLIASHSSKSSGSVGSGDNSRNYDATVGESVLMA